MKVMGIFFLLDNADVFYFTTKVLLSLWKTTSNALSRFLQRRMNVVGVITMQILAFHFCFHLYIITYKVNSIHELYNISILLMWYLFVNFLYKCLTV